MNKGMWLQYPSSIEQIVGYNESFDACVIKICYTGKNRNGSSISKQAIEDAIPSIYNCPIVCNYNVYDDTIGGHDIEIISTNNVTRMINLTDAIGVVPYNCNYHWEEIEDNGVMHEYLCVEAILWKRSSAYHKIKSDGIVSQSMEISVKNGQFVDGVYEIDKFIFTAFCLLGDDVEPCFESASLETFSLQQYKYKFDEMMEEFKENFKKVNTSTEVDIYPCKNKTEGGEEHLEQKMELLTKFSLSVDQLDFNIEEMSLEDLEVELNTRFNNVDNSVDTPDDAGSNGDNHGDGEKDNQFALLGEQFREGLIDALHVEKINTEWGEMGRYAYCDYDSEAMEVFCWDVEDWKLYGFPYSMNGDNVNIDFKCKKRKKFSIVDFDEGDTELSYKAMFDVVVEACVASKASGLSAEFEAAKTELEEKYNAASDTINNMNTELRELRQYKQDQLDSKRTADEDAVFAMFIDLNGIEAFESLKGNCSELSIEELEDKCYAIRGRNTTQTFSAQKQKSPRLPIEKSNVEGEPYGGLFVEFPPNR